MEGYKTWAGIAITVLGAAGVGKIFGDENIAGIVNAIVSIIGLVIAAYGNYKAHQKIDELKA